MELWELLAVKVLLESQDSLLLDVEGHQHLLSPHPPADDWGLLAIDPELLHGSLVSLHLAVRESEGEEPSLPGLDNVSVLACLIALQPRVLVLQPPQDSHGTVLVSKLHLENCTSRDFSMQRRDETQGCQTSRCPPVGRRGCSDQSLEGQEA